MWLGHQDILPHEPNTVRCKEDSEEPSRWPGLYVYTYHRSQNEQRPSDASRGAAGCPLHPATKRSVQNDSSSASSTSPIRRTNTGAQTKGKGQKESP